MLWQIPSIRASSNIVMDPQNVDCVMVWFRTSYFYIFYFLYFTSSMCECMYVYVCIGEGVYVYQAQLKQQ